MYRFFESRLNTEAEIFTRFFLNSEPNRYSNRFMPSIHLNLHLVLLPLSGLSRAGLRLLPPDTNTSEKKLDGIIRILIRICRRHLAR